jgi:hypothetical protein
MEKRERTNTATRVTINRGKVKFMYEELLNSNSSMNKLKAATQFQVNLEINGKTLGK